MQAKIKNIFLVCSDAQESARLQDFFAHLPNPLSITVAATSEALMALPGEIVPDIIIIRVNSEDKEDPRFLDTVRKNHRLDEIPVFVYTAQPGKKDLSSLLKEWNNVLSDFIAAKEEKERAIK